MLNTLVCLNRCTALYKTYRKVNLWSWAESRRPSVTLFFWSPWPARWTGFRRLRSSLSAGPCAPKARAPGPCPPPPSGGLQAPRLMTSWVEGLALRPLPVPSLTSNFVSSSPKHSKLETADADVSSLTAAFSQNVTVDNDVGRRRRRRRRHDDRHSDRDTLTTNDISFVAVLRRFVGKSANLITADDSERCLLHSLAHLGQDTFICSFSVF